MVLDYIICIQWDNIQGYTDCYAKFGLGLIFIQNPKQKLSIVISGWPAVGKTTIAAELAKEFRLEIYNGGDILKMGKNDIQFLEKTGGIQKMQKNS